jgi:arsenate reductase (thioredoxin)
MGQGPLEQYVAEVTKSASSLSSDRRALLDEAVVKIEACRRQHGCAELLFVCTHNSRRSQLAEVWATKFIELAKLKKLEAYSCGTEVTACNPRTIAALERVGFRFESEKAASNPRYVLKTDEPSRQEARALYSKTLWDESLPKQAVISMMCCDQADQNCPNIPGALSRVALNYVDPKVSDDTPQEAAVYDARCRQIAVEMAYLIEQLR